MPWSHLVTTDPEPFRVIVRGLIVVVEAGRRDRVIGRLDLGTKRIMQVPQGSGGTDMPVQTQRVNLSLWTGTAPPILDAHPFLLLHLLVTRQVNFEELMEMAADLGSPTLRVTLPVRRRCDLLMMVGRPQMGIRLMTSNDLSTVQA
jgi:hypothetical protein